MNKIRVSSVPLAAIALSAHTSFAHSRACFDDISYTGLAKLIADDNSDEPGAKKPDDISDTAKIGDGTGTSVIEPQQDQAAPGTLQADAALMVDKKDDAALVNDDATSQAGTKPIGDPQPGQQS